MNIQRGSDYVGAWRFALPKPDACETNEGRWRPACELLIAAANALTAEELLLTPFTAMLRHDARPPGTHAKRVVAEPAALPGELIAMLSDAKFGLGSLDLNGCGRVYAGDLSRRIDDVCGLRCNVADFGTSLTLWTLSDVWLPANLNAQPQPDIAARNAPRLEAVLRRIEALTGHRGTTEDTRFAIADGYRLRNHVVGDDVLDLADLGYDASVIADPWPQST